MRILALPRYSPNGPSSRVRMYNYLPYLKEAGFVVDFHPFFDYSYIDNFFTGKRKNILAIIRAYWQRIKIIMQADQYDLIWLQYELMPWIPFWFERLLLHRNKVLVIDYDDAVYERYQNHRSFLVRCILGKKISRLMAMASELIVGNNNLGDFARVQSDKTIHTLPSVVEKNRYQLKDWSNNNQSLRIGWIGSPSTVHYLLMIKDVILEHISNKGNLTIIGADIPDGLPKTCITSRKWTSEAEVELLRDLDVGIMPLPDNSFERGKCGYKLIQYMACGLPVIASPVGINNQLVKHGENGYLANNKSEWIEAIEALKNDKELQMEMGKKGRKLVDSIYNYAYQSQFLINIFKNAIKTSNEKIN